MLTGRVAGDAPPGLQPDEDEEIEVERLPVTDALRRLEDAASLAAVALRLTHEHEPSRPRAL